MINSHIALGAYKHLAKLSSKKLSKFVEVIGPIEIPNRYGDDALLGLLRIIVGQQISGNAARSIWNRLTDQHPDRVNLLIALRNLDSSIAGLPEKKKRTLKEIATRGDTWLNEIEKEAEDIRGAKLLEIWGLGSWSLAMWELFVRRDSDIWSDQDLILRRISQRFALEDNINRYELIRSASPFRSFLSLYCWRFNDAEKKTN